MTDLEKLLIEWQEAADSLHNAANAMTSTERDALWDKMCGAEKSIKEYARAIPRSVAT